MKKNVQTLSPKLKEIFSEVIKILGEVIKESEGEKFYSEIETYRLNMKKIRRTSHKESMNSLVKLESILKKKSSIHLNKINKSFSLYLELTNSCETAYRTIRLQDRASLSEMELNPEKLRKVSFVFTAHPTEARSPEMIRIFLKINKQIQEMIQYNQSTTKEKLRALIARAFKEDLAPHIKPTVADEAIQVSSIALRDEILSTITMINGKDIHVQLRSWAGGDKDGNPNVTEKEFLSALQTSRTIISLYCLKLLASALKYNLLPQVRKSVLEIEKIMDSLSVVKAKDGRRIKKLHKQINAHQTISLKRITPPEIQDFYNLLQMFPALVLPLEFREEAALVRLASLEKNKKSEFAITRMLQELKSVADGFDTLAYARGLILSQLETADEVKSAMNLQFSIFNKISLPVIPLLETKESLLDYKKLLNPYFKSTDYKKALKERFSGQLEVMLGYSDTSKVLGSFPSRLLLFEVVAKIHEFVKSHQTELLLFHGSGGSVDRGGGPISEQVSWIPTSLIQHYKATIQGEMISRSLASPEILLRNIEVITSARKTSHLAHKSWKDIEKFAHMIESEYSALITDHEFLNLVGKATPYSYLSTLKIGSRPSKRNAGNSFTVESLRAIPWVLCWTQTRVLIQTWWGIGSAWDNLSKKERSSIKKNYQNHPVLSSFVKLLGFTLEKIEPSILELYLGELAKNDKYAGEFKKMFFEELALTKKFFLDITGKKDFTYYRPWLGESISMRSPIIHILNIIQLQAIKREEDHLLRETVTGISSGMLTTG